MKCPIVFALLFLCSCFHSNQKSRDVVKGEILISEGHLGNIPSCNLEQVSHAFQSIRIDTITEDFEGDEWYGINLTLTDGSYLLCETPSIEENIVQRIRTNCKRIVTKRGYSVGIPLRELFEKGEKVLVTTDMEEVSFYIPEDGVYFKINEKYTSNIPESIDFNYFKKALDAKIEELTILVNCK